MEIGIAVVVLSPPPLPSFLLSLTHRLNVVAKMGSVTGEFRSMGGRWALAGSMPIPRRFLVGEVEVV